VEIALGDRSPRVEIDGKPAETCTRIVAAAGYVLTISTTLLPRGTELHSTYTGHPQAQRTLGTYARVQPTAVISGTNHSLVRTRSNP
jgi:hypothetical protein